jgi:hypothetical protein
MGPLPGTLLMPSPPESTDGVEAVVGAIDDDLGDLLVVGARACQGLLETPASVQRRVRWVWR